MFLEDARGVGVVAFHVAVPFTGASHVFRWKPAVVEGHELELGVDAALECLCSIRDCGLGVVHNSWTALALFLIMP